MIKKQLKLFVNKIKNSYNRKRLKNKTFTIINDNCWAGKVYQDLGIEYTTPFIGLYVTSPDFIKMVKNLRYYLSQPLVFNKRSKFFSDEEMKKKNYPHAWLDDIELFCLHYKDEKEVIEKWNRRIKRINWDNLFFKLNDRDFCSEDILEEFDNLEYKSKIIFTAKKHPNLKNSIYFKMYNNLECVEPELETYRKYFDVVKWLNNGGDSV